MEINKKINEVSEEILNGNTALAEEIAKDGLEAIFSGMRTGTGEITPEWEKLMRHFANDQRELDRLCGKDEKFNKSRWGLFCLAYVAGDSTCTSETTSRTGTRRSILMHDELTSTNELQDNLDAEFTELDNFEASDSNFTEILK